MSLVLKVPPYHNQCFFCSLFHTSAVYWSESRWQSPWLEELEEIFLELKISQVA